MGALAALAAQLYRADHLYHLWVDEEIERKGITEARPDPKNRYVNPTVGEGLCELVPLPFTDLSHLVDEVKKRHETPPADWSADRMVGDPPVVFHTLTQYIPAGLSLPSARELWGLIEQWREQVDEWIYKDAPLDVYYPYEIGLRRLLDQLGRHHPRYAEVLVYQQRLLENIDKTRLHGDTPTRNSERSEIVLQLNRFALSTLDVSFNNLYSSIAPMSQEHIWQLMLSILYTAGALDDAGRGRLRDLERDGIADDYAQQSVDKAREGDDLGPFQWLAENEETLTMLSKLVASGASVGTFVRKGLELWMKAQGMM
jgi:hypothetical protein